MAMNLCLKDMKMGCTEFHHLKCRNPWFDSEHIMAPRALPGVIPKTARYYLKVRQYKNINKKDTTHLRSRFGLRRH